MSSHTTATVGVGFAIDHNFGCNRTACYVGFEIGANSFDCPGTTAADYYCTLGVVGSTRHNSKYLAVGLNLKAERQFSSIEPHIC